MAGAQRSVADLLRQAGQARRAGDREKAAKLCRLVLKSYPKQPDALHLFAVLALDSGSYAEADRRFRAALAVDPASPRILFNHAIVLYELGRYEEALARCEEVLRLGGDRARALDLSGSALGRLERGAEALASFDQALALAPRDAEIHYNRANLLQQLGRPQEALAGYDAALALAPRHLGAINNRGAALRDLGRVEEAHGCYDRVLALDPRSWQAHNNRGNLLTVTGRLREARAAFEHAIRLSPRNAECHYNLGNALQGLGQHEEAMQCYGRALSIEPRYVEAYLNRAEAARRLKRYTKALADYAAAKRLRPSVPYVDGYIAATRAQACDWSRPEEEEALIDSVRRGERACDPFTLLLLGDNPADQRTCAATWAADKFARLPAVEAPQVHHDGPVRIAYLSPDYRNHATSYLLARLIELHDRARFKVFGVGFGPDSDDAMRRRIAAAFDTFIDVGGVSDLTAAQMLRAEGIDIAVDLAGHTLHARPGILARKPAPVQVSYLGYPGTTGAPFLDYIIADPWVVPEAMKAFFSEKVVHLPDSYQANDVFKGLPAPVPSRTEAGLPQAGFVFCCFNNPNKIRPHVFDVWMRLLRAVEGSVLWLLADGPESTANLQREAERRGVTAGRLVFAPRVGNAEHLARHALADLFLDTLPYNAHTTASDSLRAGVPIVTCAGGTFAGRVAASLLAAVGMAELVTHTLEEYEALALRLAREPEHLARTRAALAANLPTHALFDADRFRRSIEAAYLEMHRRYRAGEPPAAFSVPPPAPG
jgi:predicted O-linked N-acetylglucosamine transferase (SPINDLY family)